VHRIHAEEEENRCARESAIFKRGKCYFSLPLFFHCLTCLYAAEIRDMVNTAGGKERAGKRGEEDDGIWREALWSHPSYAFAPCELT